MAKRKALCVAIDDYGHPANNLNSCIADAKAFEQLLKSRYNFDEVRSLYDSQATTKNVEDGLDWLFDDSQPDDRLVFQFSGHGYQLPSDGILEEVLVLQDGFFKDDRLSQRTQQLPPGILTAVMDSCFSGGMEKLLMLSEDGLEVAKPKRWTPIDAEQLQNEQSILEKAPKIKLKPFGAKPAGTIRALGKDFGFPTLAGSAGSAPAASPVSAGNAALTPAPVSDEEGQMQMNGLLLSACVENETASAKTSQTNGLSAFTYGLVEALKEAGSQVGTADLMAAVQRRLKAMGFRQTPLMKAYPNPPNLGERSFLLLDPVSRPTSGNGSEHDIEHILELIRNALKEGNTMPMTESQASDEKFLGAVISAVTTVAPQVLPHVLNAIRKEYQPGLAAQPITAGGDEKFGLGSIIDVVRTTAPHVLPHVLNAISKEYQSGLAAPR